ncbi:MAG: calcium/sodium antiporter [Cyclobacteriaceae bacterium]|nr:calcium/sodium antiporter [Cyclobacteriaceae bacterium]
MLLTYFLFIAGFVLLIKGADLLVDGASSLGKKFKISSLVIGLTVVSFGTSLPELLVNLYASFGGNSDVGVGNILGSNIANTLLILGVSALIFPLAITKNTYFIEVPFLLTATVMVGFLANTELEFIKQAGNDSDVISRWDGFILLFFFALFMGYVYVASKEKSSTEFDEDQYKEMTMLRAFVFIGIGIVALFFGGEWVVDGAVEMALYFGLSKTFIGLTIIAIGTSLPELVTSGVAAWKKNTDIAVGNVVGSNIFNLLWILGLSAVLKPIDYHEVNNTDVYMVIGSSTALILAIVIGKRAVISRWEGFFFLVFYSIYIYSLLVRENLI